MSQVHRRGPAQIEANLTPMIDMTFLLVVFFVLVSTISEVESVEMELPEPSPTASAPPTDDPRAVINVIPGDEGEALNYRLNGFDFQLVPQGIDGLRSRIIELYSANPELLINLRADRRTEQKYIAPVLRTVTEAASSSGRESAARINLVVITERDSSNE